MSGQLKLVATVAAVAMALVACTAAEGTTKSGDAPPIVLRLGALDVPGGSTSDEVERFANSVSQQFQEAVRVDVVWEASKELQGPDDPGPDRALITLLKDGKLDLALVPARAWDDAGEGAFRVLQTPFLIQSSAAASAVARSAVAKEMLAEFSKSELTGLALLPQSLRHIVSFGEPLLEPGDFRGVPTRGPREASISDALRAIGLVPKDPRTPLADAVRAGSIRAAETDLGSYAGLPGPLLYIGNVTLYAKFLVLAGRNASLEKLSPEQRALLHTLADRTADYAVATTPDDATAAAAYCKKGGTIVLAPRSTLPAFARATAPIVKRLEANPATGAQLTAIRSIIAATKAGAPVRACAPASAKATKGRKTTVAKPPPFPEGVYRRETTAEYLLAHGVDVGLARNHAGIWTLTFKDGRFSVGDECEATYSVEGDRVSINLEGNHPDCGDVGRGELFSARWRLDGDALLFTDVLSGADGPAGQDFAEAMWGVEPFTRIG